MSWIATKYAWKCRNPLVKGSVRLVLLAVALCVEKSKLRTCPTSLKKLARLTFLSHEQIRRCLDVLSGDDVGEVLRVSRGKNAIYELPKMAGPLFAVDSEEPGKMPVFSRAEMALKSGHDDRIQPVKMTGKNRASCPPAVRTGSCTEDVRTEELIATTTEEVAAARFLTWIRQTYPLYVEGGTTTTGPLQLAAVVELIRGGRTVERLKLMVKVLWLLSSNDPDQWMATSDRGLLVLRHRADDLDRRVAEKSPAWLECRHEPHCGGGYHCVKERMTNREAVS